MAAAESEAQQRGRQPDDVVGAVLGSEMRERGAQVVPLGVQPVQPASLIWAEQSWPRSLRELQVVIRVPGPQREHRLVSQRAKQILRTVLADGLQQPVAYRVGRMISDYQALVHQRAEQVGHVELVDGLAGAQSLGGLEIEATREHRQPPQCVTLWSGQESE